MSYDSNFFQSLSFDQSGFPTDPQVVIPFTGNPSISLFNSGGVSDLTYSFDGVTIHGILPAGGRVVFEHRGVTRIWIDGTTDSLEVESTENGTIVPIPYGSLMNPEPVALVSGGSAAGDTNPFPVRIVGLTAGSSTFLRTGTLPAAGAYEATPSIGGSGSINIPSNAVRALLWFSYTQGAAGGQAAHKIFISNGIDNAQLMSVDGTFNGIRGGSSGVQYCIPVEVPGGLSYIGIASAEVGVTATPGTCLCNISWA